VQQNQQNFPRLVAQNNRPESKTPYTASDLVGKMELQKNLKFFPVIYEAVALIGLMLLCLQKFGLGYPATALITVGTTLATKHFFVLPWVKEYSHNLQAKILDMVRTSPECQRYLSIASAEEGEFGILAREILRKTDNNKAS
jgi:hypothetical protein